MEERAFSLALGEGLARAALHLAVPWSGDLLSLSIGAAGARSSIQGLATPSGTFRQKLSRIAHGLGAKPHDLALVIAFETAGTFSPKIENPVSKALGLLQFMPATLERMGINRDNAANMTDLEQLELVEQYLTPWRGKLGRLSSLYMAVLWPRLVGADEHSVVFAEGSKAYAQNAGLDMDKDGRVLVSEAVYRVKSMRSGPPRVLLMGDSIAEGLEAPLRRAATAEGAEVVVGVHQRGSTISQWAKRAPQAAAIAAPSVVLVALGSNDVHTPKGEDVDAVIKSALEWGAELAWLTPFRQNGAGESLPGLIWQSSGIVLDGQATLKEARATTASDGVHLNPANYERVGQAIWRNIGGDGGGKPIKTPTRAVVAPTQAPRAPRAHRGPTVAVGLALATFPLFMKRRK